VTTTDQTVAAGHSVEVAPARWQELFDQLLADLPRKDCWTIAEHAGDPTPDGMQHLLAQAEWNQDAVRDDVRDDVVEHRGDRKATLVIDETAPVFPAGTPALGENWAGCPLTPQACDR